MVMLWPGSLILLGIILPGIGLVLLFFLPFLDRGKKRPPLRRPVMIVLTLLVLAVMIGLTIWGQYS